MTRPITLCTGQWADLPLETLAPMAKSFGFDGLELACSGDHFQVDKALADPCYCGNHRKILERHGLQVFSISNHLVGQAILDHVDTRHKSIVPDYVWGDGNPAADARAADAMKTPPARRRNWESASSTASPVRAFGTCSIAFRPSRRR